MGCCGSKEVEEPVKPPPKLYNPFNCPIPKEISVNEQKIYSVLEYWFCSPYTEFDRGNHIRSLD